jgi:acetyl-CoA carboxylase beta subunit
MKWIKNILSPKKKPKVKSQQILMYDVAENICPNCRAKGHKTDLTDNSYACKKCGTWWTYYKEQPPTK